MLSVCCVDAGRGCHADHLPDVAPCLPACLLLCGCTAVGRGCRADQVPGVCYRGLEAGQVGGEHANEGQAAAGHHRGAGASVHQDCAGEAVAGGAVGSGIGLFAAVAAHAW